MVLSTIGDIQVTDTQLDPKIGDPSTEEGDHDKFAHIVYPGEAVTEAIITGKPCTALCGKTWVPTGDPKRYPICPTCLDIRKAAGGNLENLK